MICNDFILWKTTKIAPRLCSIPIKGKRALSHSAGKGHLHGFNTAGARENFILVPRFSIINHPARPCTNRMRTRQRWKAGSHRAAVGWTHTKSGFMRPAGNNIIITDNQHTPKPRPATPGIIPGACGRPSCKQLLIRRFRWIIPQAGCARLLPRHLSKPLRYTAGKLLSGRHPTNPLPAPTNPLSARFLTPNGYNEKRQPLPRLSLVR